MLQALFQTTGNPTEVVEIQNIEKIRPSAGEVLVRMRAAPVNPADLNFIQGTYGKMPHLPAVPGIEGVGEVEETGPGVTGLEPGRKVLPFGEPGFWTQWRILPASSLMPLPDKLDWRQAAMLRVNPATAWGLLHATGMLPPGSWVLQNAASSAAGHCVIQIAKFLGLRTLNFVRRPESAAACEALGADAVLVDGADAVPAAREILGDASVSLALNAVGGESALRLMDLLSPGGTLVTYGAMARQPLKVPNGFLIFKDIRLKGFWLSRWTQTLPEGELTALYRKLADMVAEGRLTQPVDSVFPLSRVKEALARAAESGRDGKVLLNLAEEPF